jgi:hypothetical protein
MVFLLSFGSRPSPEQAFFSREMACGRQLLARHNNTILSSERVSADKYPTRLRVLVLQTA